MNRPLPSHLNSDVPVAMVKPTDIPGLVDVTVTTGENFTDLTLNQLRYLADKHRWTVVPAEEQER